MRGGLFVFSYLFRYNQTMKYTLQSTQSFDRWFKHLKDKTVKNKILARFLRVQNGNFGDIKKINADLFEMRCFFSNGIRIYYAHKQTTIILLLVGGDKSTQSKDIKKAHAILNALET